MEKLANYRKIIQSVLLSYTEIPYSHGELIPPVNFLVIKSKKAIQGY